MITLLFILLKLFNVLYISWWWIILAIITDSYFSSIRSRRLEDRITDLHGQLPEYLRDEYGLSEVEDLLHEHGDDLEIEFLIETLEERLYR
jgi:phosphatidylglycerophosphate synthase